MALDFSRKTEVMAAPVASKGSGQAPTPPTAIIDEGSECSGNFVFKGDVRIDGSVEGKIDCLKTVTIGPSGKVEAQIQAESVYIAGEVSGDIVAKREIKLHKSACVSGDMQTAGIVIEQGARVDGRISIGKEAGASSAPRPTANPARSKKDEAPTGA